MEGYQEKLTKYQSALRYIEELETENRRLKRKLKAVEKALHDLERMVKNENPRT